MSKLTDEQILALQKEVEAKQERIKALKGKFSPETTCVYKGTNLHVQNITSLTSILSDLISFKYFWDKACEVSRTNIPFTSQGFTYEQWVADITFLIDKISLKAKEAELEEDIQFLDSLVSKDTKNKKRFDDLMAKYGKKES